MAKFTQLDEEMRVGSMRPVATLHLSPGDFAERWNVTLRPGASNLGDSLGALVQTEPDRRQFALLGYLEGPARDHEVELLAPENEDPVEAVARFLSAFGLSQGVVGWSLVPRDEMRASS